MNDRSSSGGSQRSELKIKAAAMITEEAADAVARLPSLSFSSFLSAVRTPPEAKAAALSASLVRGSWARFVKSMCGGPRGTADERKGRLTRSRNEWSPAVDIPPPAVQAAAVVAAVDVHSACIRAVRLRWRRQAGKGVDRQSDLPTDEATEARLSKQRTNGRVDGRATVRTELAKQYCRERASERARGWGGTSKVDVVGGRRR